ncbi:MAG: NUDIX domain-containing protein [Patescibacteria group bacterium]
MQIVVSAIILNSKNQVLLLKKSSHSDYFPNKWTWPGGHVGKDENLEDSLMREVDEELGIKIEIIKQGKPVFFENNKIIPFLTRTKSNGVILSNEHQEYRWINVNEINNFDLIPKIKENLKAVGF